ncbi:MAG: AsmA family protein [Pseudomonadota bacterium]|nr:AsmA family protein [Pseudomonadota bacterium]
MGVVAAVAIIFTTAALYIALVFDANRYKPEVVTAARQSTGRELAIDGDLAVGLFPQPHVRVGAGRLANPPGFDGAMVEWESLRANVGLLPLLRRHVQIDELAVDGLNIRLLKNRKGEDNWSDLTNNQEGSKSGKRFGVSIHSIRLSAAAVLYQDELKKNEVSLSEIEVRTGRLGGAEPQPVQLDAKLTSSKPALAGAVALTANAQIDPQNRSYAARGVRFAFTGDDGVDATLNGDVAADFNARSLNAEIAATLLDLSLNAKLASEAIDSQRRFRGKLTLAEFNPRSLLVKLDRVAPQTRDRSALTRAHVSFDVAGDDRGLTVEPIAARLDSSAISGKITLSNYSAPRIRFHLNVDQLDLDRYRAPTPKPPSLQDNAISKLSTDVLRDLGITVAGDVKIGKLVLAGDRSDNYRLIVEAVP